MPPVESQPATHPRRVVVVRRAAARARGRRSIDSRRLAGKARSSHATSGTGRCGTRPTAVPIVSLRSGRSARPPERPIEVGADGREPLGSRRHAAREDQPIGIAVEDPLYLDHVRFDTAWHRHDLGALVGVRRGRYRCGRRCRRSLRPSAQRSEAEIFQEGQLHGAPCKDSEPRVVLLFQVKARASGAATTRHVRYLHLLTLRNGRDTGGH